MPPVLFVIVLIAFFAFIAIRNQIAIRAERRALEEAERKFADDPAGLQEWKEQRRIRRMMRHRPAALDQQNLSQQQVLQGQVDAQNLLQQNLVQQQVQQETMNNMGTPNGMPPGT